MADRSKTPRRTRTEDCLLLQTDVSKTLMLLVNYGALSFKLIPGMNWNGLSFVFCPRFSLVVDEDIKKLNKQITLYFYYKLFYECCKIN